MSIRVGPSTVPIITTEIFERLNFSQIDIIKQISSKYFRIFLQNNIGESAKKEFWQTLFLSRFGERVSSIVKPIVEKEITTWKNAFQLFCALETMREKVISEPMNLMVMAHAHTSCLVKDTHLTLCLPYEGGFVSDSYKIGITDLLSKATMTIETGKSDEDIMITANENHVFVCADRAITPYDYRTKEKLNPLPIEEGVVAMKAQYKAFLVVCKIREREENRTINSFNVRKIHYESDTQGSVIPLSLLDEYGERIPHCQYLFSFFTRDDLSYVFLADSNFTYIKIVDLSSTQQQLITIEGRFIGCASDATLLYVAVLNEEEGNLSETFSIHIYKEGIRLQTINFLIKEYLYWDTFFVADNLIFFVCLKENFVVVFDLNERVFFTPIQNAMNFFSFFGSGLLEYSNNYFGFNPEALKHLLELFTRTGGKIDQSRFSPEEPIEIRETFKWKEGSLTLIDTSVNV